MPIFAYRSGVLIPWGRSRASEPELPGNGVGGEFSLHRLEPQVNGECGFEYYKNSDNNCVHRPTSKNDLACPPRLCVAMENTHFRNIVPVRAQAITTYRA